MVKKAIAMVSLLTFASFSHAGGLIITPPVSPPGITQKFYCQASNNHPTRTAEVVVQVLDFKGEVIQETAAVLAPLASMLTARLSGGFLNNDLPTRCKITSSSLATKRLSGSAILINDATLNVDLAIPAVPIAP